MKSLQNLNKLVCNDIANFFKFRIFVKTYKMKYIRIKENSAQAKAFLEFIKTMPFVDFIEEEDLPNSTTIRAMEQAEKGKFARHKTAKSLIKSLSS